MLLARMRFVVDAEPRSQGSMTAVTNRQGERVGVRHASAPALYYWRDKVRDAARAKRDEEGHTVWSGPIGLQISFGIRAPKDAKHGYPKQPDLDKLVRAVMDALTHTIYHDDSQVVTINAEKVWQEVTIVEVWRIERQSPKASFEQASIWKEDAEGLEAYPQTGYRKR